MNCLSLLPAGDMYGIQDNVKSFKQENQVKIRITLDNGIRIYIDPPFMSQRLFIQSQDFSGQNPVEFPVFDNRPTINNQMFDTLGISMRIGYRRLSLNAG